MATKKELKELYKQMKPDMGVFFLVDETRKKGQIFAVADLKSRINRVRFQLEMGSSPLREIQREWTSLGADRWDFRVLDHLEYDEDETKTDYSDDLELLKMEWEEKLARQGYTFF
jgi:hypothetical protein